MLVAFLIMLREGIEAALIVGIIASYLRRSGRADWLPLVGIGVAAAVLLSLGAGILLQAVDAEFPQAEQELFEAVIGLAAAGILTSMVFWMRKAARDVKSVLQNRVDTAIGTGSGLALIGMVFLAVMREGLEAVFFLLAVFQQSSGWSVPAGGLLGLAVAGCVGMAIYWGGVRINLQRFFRWTGLFILVVAAGLLASALRALHEAGLWNLLQSVPVDASAWLPADSALGTVLSGLFGYSDRPALGEIIVYVAFLAVMLPLMLRDAPRPARERQPRLGSRA